MVTPDATCTININKATSVITHLVTPEGMTEDITIRVPASVMEQVRTCLSEGQTHTVSIVVTLNVV